MKNKIIVRHENTVQIFSLSTTTNKKIVGDSKTKIVQTYTYSKNQFEYILNNKKVDFKTFFSLADTNCLDCPFSTLQNGGCYTHKFNQYTGFLSQLRSIAKVYGSYDNLPEYSNEIKKSIYQMSLNKYIRFGTYGEPVLIPIDVVKHMAIVSTNWTGYSHQWRNEKYQEYNAYLMASTHNLAQNLQAAMKGFRVFQASKKQLNNFTDLVNCPASKEAGFKSNCAKCGLCSGTEGKGTKSIFILEH